MTSIAISVIFGSEYSSNTKKKRFFRFAHLTGVGSTFEKRGTEVTKIIVLVISEKIAEKITWPHKRFLVF